MKKIGLLPRLIIAILLGIFLGSFLPEPFIRVLATFNGIFGQFLGFSIPLIIIGFVAPGIGELGSSAGKMLGLTAGIAYLSTIFSGSLAYFVDSALFPAFLSGNTLTEFANPENALATAYFESPMPPLMGVTTALLIAFTLGIGIAVINSVTIKSFMNEFQDIISRLISSVIIPLLPLHILGIFANMTYAGQVVQILSVFSKVFVVVIVLHLLIILVQFTIAGVMNGVNPLTLIPYIIPSYLTAIGTQSSAATIPINLDQTKKMGVEEGVADFVVPLCATIHLSGSTITLVSCSLAIMMMNGMAHDFGIYFGFILALGVTMVAAPGVPGGAVMAAIGLLQSMLGFDETLTSLMIALYMAQDSFGTACNVSGDAALAVIVNKFAGHKLERTPLKPTAP